MDVAVLGHIIIETIVYPDGRVLTPVLGSPAAYSSVALARLGTSVGLCTNVGEDIPQTFLEIFEEAKVDLAGMSIIGEETTRNKLVYRTMEDKHVEYSAKAPSIELANLPEKAEEAGIFYVCPMDYEVSPSVVEKLVEAGKTVIVDFGGYGGATSASHPFGLEEALAPTLEVLSSCHVAKASVKDCRCIFGDPGLEEAEKYYADRMYAAGARQVVITMGSEGVCYSSGNKRVCCPPLNCEVADTTGAGDAFAAGMIHAFLRTPSDIERMLTFAQATACHVIEKTGGVALERMPTYEEIIKRIRKENVCERD